LLMNLTMKLMVVPMITISIHNKIKTIRKVARLAFVDPCMLIFEFTSWTAAEKGIDVTVACLVAVTGRPPLVAVTALELLLENCSRSPLLCA